MSFGKMNTSIDIQEKVTGKDSAGFAVTAYNVLASVKAYREERHGNKRWERWANMAAFSSATALFRFRKIPGLEVTAKHFISDGADIYNIVSAPEDIRGRGMYIEALVERISPTVK